MAGRASRAHQAFLEQLEDNEDVIRTLQAQLVEHVSTGGAGMTDAFDPADREQVMGSPTVG